MPTPRQSGTARPIDLAFAEINALGGFVAADDADGAVRAALLTDVLAILERHGAVDPDIALRHPEPQQAAA